MPKLRSGDPCPNPRCKDEVFLCDPKEYNWPDSLKQYSDTDMYDEDVEIWLCISCGWNEAADEDEALEEHMADLEWLMGRIQNIQQIKAKDA
jgi:hypothetical protein